MAAITLAHEPIIFLADLEVRPATRTLARGDQEDIVEPRVMKVLVALLKADGAVITRDELIESCWDGRIVGDDAVNRIMSKLRRLSEGIGNGLFSVETINRVGYRLRARPPDMTAEQASKLPRVRQSTALVVSRRSWLIGAGVLASAVGIGLPIVMRRDADPPADVRELMNNARAQVRQNTREGQNQGISLYRQVAERAPDYAPGWASLSLTYSLTAHYRARNEASNLLARARETATRAQALDPTNALSRIAIASARPLMGNWAIMDPVLRQAAVDDPGEEWVLSSLSNLLQAVGYHAEALALDDRLASDAPPTPSQYYSRIRAAWYTRQPERTDRLLEEAERLYPTHFAIWFSRFYISLSTGRADTAIAMAADRATWPTNIDEEEIQSVARVADAVRSRDAAAIDAVEAEWLGRAQLGAGHAENAAQFMALLGRPAIAMRVLNAYFFGEGFRVPELRFTVEQGTYTPTSDRLTTWIGSPMLAGLHNTAEFGRLCERLGLTDFWRKHARVADWLKR